MKVALVYDRVNKFGGAERVLQTLHKIWPEAPLFTSVFNSKKAAWAKIFEVKPSFLQKLPFLKNNHELFPFLMPFGFEDFDFSGFDVVISITSAEAKGIITKPDSLHVCYCLTPTRYLWSGWQYYNQNMQFGIFNPLARLIAKPLLLNLKKWDKLASQRPDYYFAISKEVKKRIKKYYQRGSEVIYPGVDTNKFKPINNNQNNKNNKSNNKNNNYFLLVSRLVPYKRVDLVIKVFNKLGWNLKIIGRGKEEAKLKKPAKANIEFLKDLTDKRLLGYYQNCLGFVFAGEEDLGLVALEAQACGKPVLCFLKGGMAEVVLEGKTGMFFENQTEESLILALKEFKKQSFSSKECRQNALNYNHKKFIKNFKSKVEELWTAKQKNLI
jgi:glycosyltransferase involved in cell wall biosynthesis